VAGWMALGVVLGDFTAMILSLAGMGLVLSASAELFTGLRWAGALYLVYVGLRVGRGAGGWEPSGEPVREAAPPGREWRMLLHAFVVTALNPKGITFFVAFFPQFINQARPLLPQAVVLGVTFLVLGFVNAFGYALLAGRARGMLGSAHWRRGVGRLGGSLLIGAGVAAAVRKSS